VNHYYCTVHTSNQCTHTETTVVPIRAKKALRKTHIDFGGWVSFGWKTMENVSVPDGAAQRSWEQKSRGISHFQITHDILNLARDAANIVWKCQILCGKCQISCANAKCCQLYMSAMTCGELKTEYGPAPSVTNSKTATRPEGTPRRNWLLCQVPGDLVHHRGS
jgi:hypothetical protein